MYIGRSCCCPSSGFRAFSIGPETRRKSRDETRDVSRRGLETRFETKPKYLFKKGEKLKKVKNCIKNNEVGTVYQPQLCLQEKTKKSEEILFEKDSVFKGFELTGPEL